MRTSPWLARSTLLMALFASSIQTSGAAPGLGREGPPADTLGEDDVDPDSPLTALDLPSANLPYGPDDIHYFEQPDFVLYRQSEQRWDRKLHKALGLDSKTELSLTHRNRFESVSHGWRRGMAPRTGGAPETDQQIIQRTRFRLGRKFGDHFWLLFEGQDARTFDSDPGEFFGTAVEDHNDIQQLFASWTETNAFDQGLRTDLHVGRLTFEYGGTRTIGRNVLPNATNTFDGIHYQVGRPTKWRTRAFYTQPVDRNVEDPNESDGRKTFSGLLYENDTNAHYNLDIGWQNFRDKLLPGLASHSIFDTYTFRVLRERPREAGRKTMRGAGQFDYEVDTFYQVGDKGGKEFRGEMAHVEAAYTWNSEWFPRLSLFHDHASGTPLGPDDPRNLTADRLFGLRDFDLGATADYGPFARQNIRSTTVRVEARPMPDIRFYYKHAVRHLEEERDFFIGSALTGFTQLRDPTGAAGDDLGHDSELSILKTWDTNHFLEFRWAHWWKGTYFDRLPASAFLPPGGNEDTDYFLLSFESRL